MEENDICAEVETLIKTVDRLQTQVDDLERMAEDLENDLGNRITRLEDDLEEVTILITKVTMTDNEQKEKGK